ncbi:hypothetical protein [Pseudactinotalea sp. Z1732]|uniref:hypothetical protein n=1 Tax=Micrococcales TaxID=85006 RepID=UPI003C79B28F
MALQWARLDTNIASHDKILDLLGYEDGRAIAFSYICCIAYSVGNGTDGHIPFAALPFVHASKRDMETMVDAGLVDPNPKGWTVRNFADRQQVSAVATQIHQDKKRASAKGNCVRHHGADCGCWKARIA